MRIKQRESLLLILFLAGVLLGTVFAVIFRGIYETKISVYQPDFRRQLSGASFGSWEFFLYILQTRFWEFAACVLLSMTVIAYPAFGMIAGYTGFCMAGMVAAAVFVKGWSGIFLFLSSVLPHYLLYGIAVILLMIQSCFQNRISYIMQSYLFIGMLFLLGIFAEAWFSPWLLKFCFL